MNEFKHEFNYFFQTYYLYPIVRPSDFLVCFPGFVISVKSIAVFLFGLLSGILFLYFLEVNYWGFSISVDQLRSIDLLSYNSLDSSNSSSSMSVDSFKLTDRISDFRCRHLSESSSNKCGSWNNSNWQWRCYEKANDFYPGNGSVNTSCCVLHFILFYFEGTSERVCLIEDTKESVLSMLTFTCETARDKPESQCQSTTLTVNCQLKETKKSRDSCTQ